MTRRIRQALALGPLLAPLLAAGCSCQQEYSFPQAADIATFEAPEDFGSWLSMDTSPEGARLTIAYYDREAGALGYAVGLPQEDGTVEWAHEPVDGYKGSDGLDRGDRGKYASQRTAPDGTVWLAYQDVANGGLYVAHRTLGPTWTSELVDPGNGAWASLALDEAGLPVVAHQDADDGELRLSRFDGTAWSTETIWTGSDWSATDPNTGELLYREANVGSHVRLEIVDGVEYIAFHDAAQQTLDLLEGSAGSYTHTVVDDSGHVGQWPSLAIDGDTVYIAYHHVGDQDLKLATRTGGSWNLEVVDDGDYRGADTEVFLRGSKTAIVYFDGYDNDMRIATRDGSSWVLEQAAGADGAAGFHNEVVQLGDSYWLGSYDFTSRQLQVVRID